MSGNQNAVCGFSAHIAIDLNRLRNSLTDDKEARRQRRRAPRITLMKWKYSPVTGERDVKINRFTQDQSCF
jgi:hypothetical protein